jgi:hypothetical protein
MMEPVIIVKAKGVAKRFGDFEALLCPGLPYGATVEVRKLMERCGASQMVKDAETSL